MRILRIDDTLLVKIYSERLSARFKEREIQVLGPSACGEVQDDSLYT